MTSRGHNLVLCTDKRPQKIIIRYSTQTNDLTKVITHYSMQKYDLKMSQSRIPHRQTTSKDHNPVFHTDKRPHKGHNLVFHKDKWPHKGHKPDIPHTEIWPQGHNLVFHIRLMTSQIMTSQMHSTSKDKGHNLVSHHRLMTSLVYKTSDLNKGKGHT